MTIKHYTSAKEFLQFRKEIRGSKDHLIVGIDVAKNDHKAFFGTANGKVLLKQLAFKNDIEGFEDLLHHVSTHFFLDRSIIGRPPLHKFL